MAVQPNNSRLLEKRIRKLFLFILVAYLSLVARLIYLQAFNGQKLFGMAKLSRETTLFRAPHEGSILGITGTPLASTVYKGTVGFDPEVILRDDELSSIQERKQKVKVAVSYLSAVLDVPEPEIGDKVWASLAKYEQNPKSVGRFVPLMHKLPLVACEKIRRGIPKPILSGKIHYTKLFGFGIQDEAERRYPLGDAAPQLVGYRSGTTATGLENGCRTWTQGEAGKVHIELAHDGTPIPGTEVRIRDVKDGLDVQTTIEPYIQQIAMQEAKRIYEKFKPREGVCIIVVEPSSGAILAMASAPTFDPNPEGHVFIHNGDTAALADFASRQWERGVTRVCEPGS